MSPTRAGARAPKVPDSACSRAWEDLDVPSWGTAAPARFWLAVEQSGPWGHSAFTESRMDPDIGSTLERGCAYAGGRALLIRSVGAHRTPPEQRRVFLAGGMAQWQPWLLSGVVDDLTDLLGLPWDAIRFGDVRGVLDAVPALTATTEPHLLVCTNAKRDACCATRGRPLAAAAAELRPGQVWECTHTGGHRFAPTGIVLPTGQTLARLTPELAVAALDAAAEGTLAPESLSPRHNRGMAHYDPAVQAAEAWVRHATGTTALAGVSARAVAPGPAGPSSASAGRSRGRPRAADVDVDCGGRTWELRAEERGVAHAPERTSCTTAPVPVIAWQVTER